MTHKAQKRWILLGAIIITLLIGGCQASKSIDEAETVLDKAFDAHAEYLAPFEYTSAELYLAEAKSQLDHSDFSAAQKHAQTALKFAQQAYSVSREKQTALPVPKGEPFIIQSIVLVPRPKEVMQANMDRAKKQLENLKKAGAEKCAPKEYAAALAHMAFCSEEWEERDYNKAATHLRKVQAMVERMLPYTEDCKAAGDSEK